MEFKDRLKGLREEQKLLQKELAEKLGVSRYTIVRYESGKINPDIENIKKLANIFDCTVDYLLGVSNIKKAQDDFLVLIDTVKRKNISEQEALRILDLVEKLRQNHLE